MKRRLIAALTAATLLIGAPPAIAVPDDSGSSRWLPSLSSQSTFPDIDNSFSLAAIAIVDGSDISSCAGVTLNSEWVVSAAHCFPKDVPQDSYTIFTDVRSGVEEIRQIDGSDIALARLTGAPPSVGCTPLPESSPEVGQHVAVSTFRGTGGIEQLPFTVQSVEHMADNPAAGVGTHPMLALEPVPGGVLTRDGDSGSGVFVTGADEAPRLVGLVSGLSQTGDVTLAEDLARYADSIENVVGTCRTVPTESIIRLSS